MAKEKRNMYRVNNQLLNKYAKKNNKTDTESINELLNPPLSNPRKRQDIMITDSLKIIVKQMRNNGN